MEAEFLKTDLTKRAFDIACVAHAGQLDKGGHPAYLHPVAVASRFQDEDLVAAALLHDVLEDSDYTPKDLLSLGIPKGVVFNVLTLTRMPGEQYFDYIRRVSQNEQAKQIKLADLEHNSDLSRLQIVTPRDKERTLRYRKAMDILRGRASSE